MKPDIELHRVYDHAGVAPGRYRVLVDRLWPRGVRREDLAYDSWPKDLAPSPELRRWFGHRPERWAEFHERYAAELKGDAQRQGLSALLRDAGDRPVTLLYGARDPDHNHALVLRDALLRTARHASP